MTAQDEHALRLHQMEAARARLQKRRLATAVVYLREIDAGTDNACWVVCAKGDPSAVAFMPEHNQKITVADCPVDLCDADGKPVSECIWGWCRLRKRCCWQP